MGDMVTAINFLNQALSIPRPEPTAANPQLQYQLLSSSVVADATLAPALYELANANRDMGLHHAAIACYRRLLQMPVGDQPTMLNAETHARALVNLAHSLYTVGRIEESLLACDAAVEAGPHLSQAWLSLSLTKSLIGDLSGSLVCAEKAFELDPNDPVIETGLAFAYLFAGKFDIGLRHFEARFPYRLRHFLGYPYPKWQGEEGKTIYLVSEQGIGDALSFARFVELAAARSKHIHIVVQKELVRLLSASFQHIRNIDIMGAPQPFIAADYWTTFMSLPTALGLSTEEIVSALAITIPPFTANPNFKNPDSKFHIAVAWKGAAIGDINHWKSFPIDMLLRLYEVPGIQLYSIQADSHGDEIHSSGSATLIRDMRPFIMDVADTVGILRHMDLVITVESLPGHIASAMGMECWIPYSRWGRDFRASADGSRPIWSPNHTFFRQGPDATWGPVFDEIVEALHRKVESHG